MLFGDFGKRPEEDMLLMVITRVWGTLWAHCRLFRCDPEKFCTMCIFRGQTKFRNIKAIRALPLDIGRTIRSCQKVASHEVVRSKSTTGGNKKQ